MVDLAGILAEVAAAPSHSRADAVRSAVARLTALGEDAVAPLIQRVDDLVIDYYRFTDEDACLSALVAIGTPDAVAYVLERASRVIGPVEPSEVDRQVGIEALDALAESTDPAVHERLMEWVLGLGDAQGWDDTVVWHLIDAAEPHLDERARPVLERLARHPDEQDVAPTARLALRGLDRPR